MNVDHRSRADVVIGPEPVMAGPVIDGGRHDPFPKIVLDAHPEKERAGGRFQAEEGRLPLPLGPTAELLRKLRARLFPEPGDFADEVAGDSEGQPVVDPVPSDRSARIFCHVLSLLIAMFDGGREKTKKEMIAQGLHSKSRTMLEKKQEKAFLPFAL